jgi:mono/diheme cytochrome c family protein
MAFFVLAALVVALGGCGGSGSPTGSASGRALFAQDCSGCHSLSGHEDPRRQGGDLLRFRVSRAQMVQFVQEMPVRQPLGVAAVRTVADYVLSVERAGH